MTTTPDQRFTPSHRNSKAIGIDENFTKYIQTMTDMIKQARLDLTPDNTDAILRANAPFEWEPNEPKQPNGKYTKGMLFIHGLFISPYYTMDLARYFQNKGYLVRSLLLPGHGTRPGDLLDIHYSEWEKVAQFGIEQMLSSVKDMYVCGISLGGALTLEYAYHYPQIKALLLFAPALKPSSFIINVAKLHPLFSWISPNLKWFAKPRDKNFVRYNCMPFNSAVQALNLMKKVHRKTKSKPLNIPMYITATSDDEVISTNAIIDFFRDQPNANNRLQLFTNDMQNWDDERISLCKSAIPEQKILDLSHECLPISPDDMHLGSSGDFKDFVHYRSDRYKKVKDIYQGATTLKNLRKYVVQRITYNPFFPNLLDAISDFLTKIK